MEGVPRGSIGSSAAPAPPVPPSVHAALPDTEPASSASEPSMESLLRLRAQIDEEVLQRFTQEVCLMFADVVGSTRFYQQHGDVKGRLLVQRHNDTLFPLIQHTSGKVVKTIGDGIMATFAAPGAAFDCAVAIQRKLWEMNEKADAEAVLHTKISLHYGPALVETNDVYGDLVNMTARLNSMAESDQILISQTVYEHVKSRNNLVLLPLEPLYPKVGEKSIPVYEVVWQQHPEAADKAAVFRNFKGDYTTCFYCGLQEHPVRNCPSKQIKASRGQLERLGYLPTPDILRLLQEEDLNASSPPTDARIYEAFYDISLPFQLRFLPKLWLANSEDWHKVERFSIPATNSLSGTRLWLGIDCLRVGRYEQAKTFLEGTLAQSPNDYKPQVVMGFLAMEQDNPSAALQYWRKSLTLAKNSLQEAYIHLLLHRLYAINGKIDMANRELQRALTTHRFLPEAVYRQVTLLTGEDKTAHVSNRILQLIKDDRSVYLKVLLDPAFATIRTAIYPLLIKLFEETKAQALQCLQQVIGQINTLRLWYRQPEAELIRLEQMLTTMRTQVKSDSYFGYCDVTDAGTNLQERISKLLRERKTFLIQRFVNTLGAVHMQLQVLANHGQAPSRVTKLQAQLAALQRLPRKTISQFWRAWDDLEKLQADMEPQESGAQRRPSARRQHTLRHLLLYALAGTTFADTALVGVCGYLTYFSSLRLSGRQFLIILLCGALGGALIGGWLRWLWQYVKR